MNSDNDEAVPAAADRKRADPSSDAADARAEREPRSTPSGARPAERQWLQHGFAWRAHW